MYRNNTQLLTDNKVNFVLNHGALGDVITSLPAIIHARLSYNEILEMRVWCPPWQIDLIRHLLEPYGKFEVLNFQDFPLKKAQRAEWDGGPTAINQIPHNTHTRNRVHMVDYAFNCLLDAQPENMDERSYPVMASLGEFTLEPFDGAAGYVVFPVGATSDNKLFRASVMVPVMQWVLEQGYVPVIVGTKTSHTHVEANGELTPVVLRDEADKIPADVLAQCVDVREKTTLLQLRDLCGYANAVVGVDGGTIHLAGTTDVPIVYGLTTTLPKHRYIPRHGDANYRIRYVGPRDLECAGCQSNWKLLFYHDFRNCAYKDNLCTERLHPQDFIDALKQLGL